MNPIPISIAVVAVQELHKKGTTGILNLAGSQRTSMREVSEIISNVVGRRAVFELQEETEREQNFLLGSIEELRSQTGLHLECDLEKSLYEMILT